MTGVAKRTTPASPAPSSPRDLPAFSTVLTNALAFPFPSEIRVVMVIRDFARLLFTSPQSNNRPFDQREAHASGRQQLLLQPSEGDRHRGKGRREGCMQVREWHPSTEPQRLVAVHEKSRLLFHR